MKVIIPALSGFCPGVKSAERNIFRIKERSPAEPLYVYGYLINNRKYIAHLAGRGVHTVDSIDAVPRGATAVIRTHGLDKNEEAALRKRAKVVDLTCAKVKKVQREIEARAAAGFFIVIVGTKDHPETRGHVSYAGECAVAENADACDAIVGSLARPAAAGDEGGRRKVFLCAQTTAPRELFELVLDRLRKIDGICIELEVYDSICAVTDRKERTALKMQRAADVTFVIGDRISANANKLFRILSAPGRRAFFVEDLVELRTLNLSLAHDETALLVSSASTPLFIEREIASYLESV
jgi:4-hydroxy-3-methylbut-2-enyl diphosphate reductase